MDSRVKQILNSFSKTLEGDLYFDDVTRSAYSTDASIYQIVPDAVFCPQNSLDLRRIVEICSQERIPVIGRGSGTNMTGGVLGKGLVIDFSKYMTRIKELNSDSNYVIVEGGVVHGNLQNELAKYGKFFPPDPSSTDYCTIGGVTANNSSGIHAVKYGDTKDWVLDLSVVLSSGRLVSSANLSKRKNLHNLTNDNLESFEDLLNFKVYRLLKENSQLIAGSYPFVTKNSSGYNLKEAISDSSIDWNKIFVGSEGTLGLFRDIKLKIANIAQFKRLFLCSFSSLESALKHLEEILELIPSAMEMIDDILLELIILENDKIKSFLPEGTKTIVLIELDSNIQVDIEGRTEKLNRILKKTAIRVDVEEEQERRDFLWSIRKAASPILNRVKGRAKPVRFVEDIAVHPSKLLNFIGDLKKLLGKHGLTSTVYGHVGSGNIHVNPVIDSTRPDFRSRVRLFSDETYALVKEYSGTITGEHGDGLLRAPYVNSQYGELVNVFKQLKSILDPVGIMNPGKKISDETGINLDSLRYDYDFGKDVEIFKKASLSEELSKCHGCGTCRHYCPVAITTKDEKDSARSKVNLLKMLASGNIPADENTLKALKEVIDHCMNCNQCLVSCPTVIDIPLLCLEAKKVLNKKVGTTLADKYFGDVKSIVKTGSLFGSFSNFLLKNSTSRFFLEKTIGIDRRRNLPEFSRAKFKKKIKSKELLEGEKVLYHPGCFGMYNDPGESEGTLFMLQKAKIKIKIHNYDSCYVSAMSHGTYDSYLENIKENLKVLRSFVERGYKVITSSASCGFAMKVEYPSIIGSEDAQAVSQNVLDIHEYLLDLKSRELFNPEFPEARLKIAFHTPCHLRAQKMKIHPVELLSLVPGVEIKKLPDYCCGIAGTFGMKKKNFDLSMKMGARLFDEIGLEAYDFIVTSCGTCKIQIEQGTGEKVVHSMKFLARALERADT